MKRVFLLYEKANLLKYMYTDILNRCLLIVYTMFYHEFVARGLGEGSCEKGFPSRRLSPRLYLNWRRVAERVPEVVQYEWE